MFCRMQAIIGTVTSVIIFVGDSCKCSLSVSQKCQNTVMLYKELLNMKLGKQGFVNGVM